MACCGGRPFVALRQGSGWFDGKRDGRGASVGEAGEDDSFGASAANRRAGDQQVNETTARKNSPKKRFGWSKLGRSMGEYISNENDQDFSTPLSVHPFEPI